MYSAEPVDALAELAVAQLSGQGFAFYDAAPASGVSVQVGARQVPTTSDEVTIAVFVQGGGLSFPLKQKEQVGFAVNVDARTRQRSLDASRAIYGVLHDRHAFVVSGTRADFKVLWVRSTSGPPQMLGNGPGEEQRWLSTVNYDALIVLQ